MFADAATSSHIEEPLENTLSWEVDSALGGSVDLEFEMASGLPQLMLERAKSHDLQVT
jgi:hypothetical protein